MGHFGQTRGGQYGKRISWQSILLVSLLTSIVIAGASIATAGGNRAESASVVKPEAVGFSPDLPQKIHDALQRHIAAGDTPAAVVLVARKGRVAYWDAQGVMDPKMTTPLQKDTVFWVASMTKPIVATSIMMMVEAGKLSVGDPVSKYIPEFKTPAKVRVLKPGSAPPTGRGGPNAPKPEYDLVPSNRPITIQDLLTHTSGIQSIGVAKEELPVYHDGDTLASWVPKLGAVPLDFQPGTKWAYSNAAGFDILARIVEVTSGETFDHFVQQRIFDPLGMKDSSFGPRPSLQSRTLWIAPAQLENPCIAGKTFFCGSAGLWMPADDYWRFSEMLLNKGSWNGHRLLKPKSVETMATNHIGDLFPGSSGIGAAGVGFGYSLEVIDDHAAANLALPNGTFGWNGVGTRQFWIIPQEKMVIVMYLPSGKAPVVHRDVESAVMSSLKH